MTSRAVAHKRRGGRGLGRHAVLIILAVYFVVPFWWLIVASTKDNSGLFSGSGGPLWFDSHFKLFDNIAGLFSYDGGIYWRWLFNSFAYAFVGGAGATLLSALAGYGFAKFAFRGRGAYLAAVLGSVMVPTTALAVPLFVLFSGLSLTNTPWAIILPSMLSPFGTYLMYVFAKESVADDILDAARVDGAGEARLFFRLALPLMRPGLVTVFLLSIVHTWNNYFLPLVLLSDVRLMPVTVGLGRWQALAAGSNGVIQPWSFIITGALVSVVPLILAFLFLQRYWQGGLSLGSLK